MFDKYLVKGGPKHVTVNANITEKKAPTDDSVRLMREMEKEVLDTIQQRLQIRDNVFGEILHLLSPCGDDLILMFSLNGKKYQIKVDRMDLEPAKGAIDPAHYVEHLYKHISEAIAHELLKYAATERV